MGNKRRYVLLFCLVFAGICVAAEGEPNDLPFTLKFETGTEAEAWVVGRKIDEQGKTVYYPDPGPIKPKYVAEVMFSQKVGYGDQVQVLKRVEKSSLAEKLSQAQKDFLTTGFGIRVDYETRRTPDYYSIWFYAVSQDDAKRTAEAFLEVVAEEATARLREWAKARKELEQRIADIEKHLPEKENKAKAAKSRYEEVKNVRYFYLADTEAYEKAKEIMLQMGKMRDVLEIELAGIREKLSAIGAYRKSTEFSGATRDKLEQMFVEQMIELRSAEARNAAIIRIRNREKEFRECFDRWGNLVLEVTTLRDSLSNCERRLRKVEEELANPSPAMLPPKVLENKVTIYPVRVD